MGPEPGNDRSNIQHQLICWEFLTIESLENKVAIITGSYLLTDGGQST